MKRKRVLVVEDSETMRELVAFALRRAGHLDVVQAGDGAAAFKLLSKEHFDLLVTDINMPTMDGLKLIALVRRGQANAEMPIVVVTTESGLADRDRALTLGADAYITKPVQASVLLTVVREVLGD